MREKVVINLVDNNGLTPIHVAIKKGQRQALVFAKSHNRTVRSHDPKVKFDFNLKGKKSFTPLHYAVIKSNYEAFLYLLGEKLSNLFA